jgi:hypothetical protein
MYRILRKLGRVVGRLVIAVHQTTQRQPVERDIPVPAKASQAYIAVGVWEHL